MVIQLKDSTYILIWFEYIKFEFIKFKIHFSILFFLYICI